MLKPWEIQQIRVIQSAEHFVSSIIFQNLLTQQLLIEPISYLPKLLQPALTMQFRTALNEAES